MRKKVWLMGKKVREEPMRTPQLEKLMEDFAEALAEHMAEHPGGFSASSTEAMAALKALLILVHENVHELGLCDVSDKLAFELALQMRHEAMMVPFMGGPLN